MGEKLVCWKIISFDLQGYISLAQFIGNYNLYFAIKKDKKADDPFD